MRQFPTGDSQVVSQALFGETIQVLERTADWVLIQTPDHYSGWVQEDSFILRETIYRPDLQVSRLSAHLYLSKDVAFGPSITLPYGSPLQLIKTADLRWHQIELPSQHRAYIQVGDVEVDSSPLLVFVKKFLGLPYTWGGRSSFGYDCSGFVQMIYQRQGILLPRDACQQILDPRLQRVKSPQAGDLIFWGKSEGEIKHVALYLGDGEFIHASSRENKPYLRISALTDSEWSGGPSAFYPFRVFARAHCLYSDLNR